MSKPLSVRDAALRIAKAESAKHKLGPKDHSPRIAQLCRMNLQDLEYLYNRLIGDGRFSAPRSTPNPNPLVDFPQG